ncbi:MAG: hypothetical protein EXQ87_07855 [Alphaproteobacteria bacterium]|nr:hypothetical protein [Alphaproteobacteria bacterium]
MTRTSRIVALGALACAGLLAACSGVTQNYAVYPSYVGSAATYAAADRDLKLVVIGNPTALPKEAFDSAVAFAMQGKNGQSGTRFATAPGETWRKDYRVVVAFGAPISAAGAAYCRAAPPSEAVTEQHAVQVVLAFCDGERLLSEVLASVSSLVSAADLDRLMAATVYALMPPLSSEERIGPSGGNRRS